MKETAINSLTRMVNISGRRFSLLSLHSAFSSSLWFFFITIALRKGEIIITVRSPQTALAHQWGRICLINGRKKENIRAIAAADKIEYTTVCLISCFIRLFHLLLLVDG